MSKATKSDRSAKKTTPKTVELDPNAWERFERLVRQAAKAGPKHLTASKRKKRKNVK